MVKVLGQAGTSLADVYDVEGSIAGVDQLLSEDVNTVHEMGDTIASERFSGAIRRLQSGAINQSTSFGVSLTDLPAGVWRILNIAVLGNQTARTANLSVLMADTNGREIPLFVWDVAQDIESVVRIDENGAGATNLRYFIGNPGLLGPTMGVGTGQPQRVDEIAFRGTSSAFGAGTVTYTLLIYIALMQVGGLSSIGLPVPSW